VLWALFAPAHVHLISYINDFGRFSIIPTRSYFRSYILSLIFYWFGWWNGFLGEIGGQRPDKCPEISPERPSCPRQRHSLLVSTDPLAHSGGEGLDICQDKCSDTALRALQPGPLARCPRKISVWHNGPTPTAAPECWLADPRSWLAATGCCCQLLPAAPAGCHLSWLAA